MQPADMERRRRPFKRYVAFALLVFLMPVFAFGAAVAATGTISVRVHEQGEDGVNLYLPVPALLVDLAVFAAPSVMPEDALAEARAEIAPFREGLDILAEELENMPSGVLVDVHTGDEHIRVTKTWRSFEIEVDSDDVDVRVKVPARLASRVLDVL
ncbi:MAG: hypothetical protein GY719_00100 [bacterium]|nr:hypothetical protein [bacterium]